MMRRVVLVAVVCALLTGGLPAGSVMASEGYGAQMGWGVAAVGANLLYMPTKLVYATVGGLTGGLAYLLTIGNADAAKAVWSPSLGGTYVLTPEMLRGDQSILFSGESYEKERR